MTALFLSFLNEIHCEEVEIKELLAGEAPSLAFLIKGHLYPQKVSMLNLKITGQSHYVSFVLPGRKLNSSTLATIKY